MRIPLIIAVLVATSFAPPAVAQGSPEDALRTLPRSEARALALACRADASALCAEIKPGEGRVLACLLAAEVALSEPCRSALDQARARVAQ